MAEHKPNREYKASLFVSLFGEPAKMLELYTALSGIDYPPDTPVEVATLTDVLFMDRIMHKRRDPCKLSGKERIGGTEYADAGMGYG